MVEYTDHQIYGTAVKISDISQEA